jgi:hypothetical protein
MRQDYNPIRQGNRKVTKFFRTYGSPGVMVYKPDIEIIERSQNDWVKAGMQRKVVFLISTYLRSDITSQH